MGKSCGWPLNVLMTPRMNPFFAASYIPKYSRPGLVGMLELVPQVVQIWQLQKAELEIVGTDIKSRIEAFEKRTPENELGKEVLDDAYEKLKMDFDEEHGGFGRAPKFPRPHSLLFLLRYWKRSGDENALDMVVKTLRQMRLGGIFDQVGFGFHRYSTDAEWLVPHFEKMLYDQALLALAYVEAYQATGAGKFKLTAKETLEYVLRDLAAPEGGFYSAEDADSEGEEGKFYMWTEEEVKKAVQPENANLAIKLFGVDSEGNYFDAAIGKLNGKNILHFPQPLEQIASEAGLTLDEFIVRLGQIQKVLFEARKKRVAPAKDDKILTDWNGLMIAALARASQVLNDQKYLQAAAKAADFFLNKMKSEDGTLYHRFAKGERAVEGFLDDYAFLVFGLTELYEASFEDKYLEAASALTKTMSAKFFDATNGGFFFTAKRADAMPRMKQVYDGAVPSGNSTALLNLLRLSRLTGDPAYEEMAAKTFRLFAEEVKGAPQAYTFLLAALDFAVGPAYNVVLVGDLKEKDTVDMLASLRKQYLPNLTIALRQPNQAGLGYEKIDGKATAYVCRNQTCMPPTNSIEKMLELLSAK
jgi:uncharacterized protein